MMHREDFQQGYLDYLAEAAGKPVEEFVPLSSDAAWDYECGRKVAMAKTASARATEPI